MDQSSFSRLELQILDVLQILQEKEVQIEELKKQLQTARSEVDAKDELISNLNSKIAAQNEICDKVIVYKSREKKITRLIESMLKKVELLEQQESSLIQ